MVAVSVAAVAAVRRAAARADEIGRGARSPRVRSWAVPEHWRALARPGAVEWTTGCPLGGIPECGWSEPAGRAPPFRRPLQWADGAYWWARMMEAGTCFTLVRCPSCTQAHLVPWLDSPPVRQQELSRNPPGRWLLVPRARWTSLQWRRRRQRVGQS